MTEARAQFVPADDVRWRRLLESNCGFDQPETWIDYARTHGFKRVRAETVQRCPDCGSDERRTIAQYVWYSTLARLVICRGCGLVYSNARIDPSVVQGHFESAYKDEHYFVVRRRLIFEELVRVIDELAPKHGRVLDIGGGKGHLMARLRQVRPDLGVVVNDVSSVACTWAASEYGLDTVCGRAADIEPGDARFDVVCAADVIYYEADLSRFWERLSRILVEGGAVVIRVPNMWGAIRAGERVRDLCASRSRRRRAARVVGFNPEHLFVCSREYLVRRLGQTGFRGVEVRPAALLCGDGPPWKGVAYRGLAHLLYRLSKGRLLLTPSMLVIGRSFSRSRAGAA